MIAFADNGYLLMRIKRAAAQLALPMRRFCARATRSLCRNSDQRKKHCVPA